MLYGTDMRVCTVCGSKLSFSSDDMNARDFFVDRGANLQSSLLHVSPSLSELRAAPDFLSRCFLSWAVTVDALAGFYYIASRRHLS